MMLLTATANYQALHGPFWHLLLANLGFDSDPLAPRWFSLVLHFATFVLLLIGVRRRFPDAPSALWLAVGVYWLIGKYTIGTALGGSTDVVVMFLIVASLVLFHSIDSRGAWESSHKTRAVVALSLAVLATMTRQFAAVVTLWILLCLWRAGAPRLLVSGAVVINLLIGLAFFLAWNGTAPPMHSNLLTEHSGDGKELLVPFLWMGVYAVLLSFHKLVAWAANARTWFFANSSHAFWMIALILVAGMLLTFLSTIDMIDIRRLVGGGIAAFIADQSIGVELALLYLLFAGLMTGSVILWYALLRSGDVVAITTVLATTAALMIGTGAGFGIRYIDPMLPVLALFVLPRDLSRIALGGIPVLLLFHLFYLQGATY